MLPGLSTVCLVWEELENYVRASFSGRSGGKRASGRWAALRALTSPASASSCEDAGRYGVTPHKSKLDCALPGFATGNQGACGPEGHGSRSPAGGVATLLDPGLSLLASWACVHVCAGRRSSGVFVDRAAAWYTNGEGLRRDRGKTDLHQNIDSDLAYS